MLTHDGSRMLQFRVCSRKWNDHFVMPSEITAERRSATAHHFAQAPCAASDVLPRIATAKGAIRLPACLMASISMFCSATQLVVVLADICIGVAPAPLLLLRRLLQDAGLNRTSDRNGQRASAAQAQSATIGLESDLLHRPSQAACQCLCHSIADCSILTVLLSFMSSIQGGAEV